MTASSADASEAETKPDPEHDEPTSGWSLQSPPEPTRNLKLSFDEGSAGHSEAADDANDEVPERDDLVAAIREVYRQDAEPKRRKVLVASLAEELDLDPEDAEVAKALSSAITAGVKRGVIEKQSDGYHLLCAHIGQYEPAFLREMLIASMPGKRWQKRKAVIRSAARYLGFTRAGSKIQEAFKKAITASLRAGELESNNDMIRRT